MGVKTSDLDLDLVRCFLTVAESGSFTVASRRLHLSQSAVSLKIQRLEALLGRAVFTRSSRSMALTSEGDLVLGYARRLLELSQEMMQLVAQPAMAGTLRLGVAQQFGQQFLPGLLADFKHQRPNVSLTVEVGMTADLLAALEEERFDLVLGAAGFSPRPGSRVDVFVEDRVLLREPLFWAESAKVSLDLKKDAVPLILFGAPCAYRRTAIELLERAGRPWQVVYSSASLPSIQAAVEAGLGISVLGRSSMLPGMKVVNAAARLPALPQTAFALYTRKSPSESLVRSLGTFIEQAVVRWQGAPLARSRSADRRGKTVKDGSTAPRMKPRRDG